MEREPSANERQCNEANAAQYRQPPIVVNRAEFERFVNAAREVFRRRVMTGAFSGITDPAKRQLASDRYDAKFCKTLRIQWP